MVNKILITGHPGVGKTTLLKKVIARCADLALTGFYTEEIRENGVRVGFKAVGLNGSSAVFAHKNFQTGPERKVGKYGVKPEALESLVLPHIDAQRKGADLVVIDEIAKMELISKLFRQKLIDLVESDSPVFASISLKGTGLIKDLKRRKDVELFTLTQQNRDVLIEQVYRSVKRITGAG
ncbi:MAG: NTPase [Acidobacteriota bacterium]